MAEGRHIENLLSAISQRHIVQLTRKLGEEAESHCYTPRDRKSKFRKSKVADIRQFQNGFSILVFQFE